MGNVLPTIVVDIMSTVVDDDIDNFQATYEASEKDPVSPKNDITNDWVVVVWNIFFEKKMIKIV